MLCVVGDLVEDVIVGLHGPVRRGTDTTARIERARGGSGANLAAFAAAAGERVRFIGRVGADTTGAALATELDAAGVDVRVQRAGHTGTIVVLVEPGGERTMLPDRGAAAELADVDLSWVDGVTWMHVPAYSLVVEPIGSASLGLIAAVRAGGGRISVDASSVAAIADFGPDRFDALLDGLEPDVVFANEDEARLLSHRPRLLVVKRGPRPVLIDGRRRTEVPVPPVAGVADSTGAGDAFAAGFIAATMAGADPVAAATAGSALAARTLRMAGARLAP